MKRLVLKLNFVADSPEIQSWQKPWPMTPQSGDLLAFDLVPCTGTWNFIRQAAETVLICFLKL
jgi:hypothetical protein